jgi:hypothetical protein
MFARLGGRVLSEFDPRRHLVNDYLPDRSLRHFLIIDPGWKIAGHLFAAVDTKGRITAYAEHYAKQEAIPDRMKVLHALWQGFGKPELDVIMDAANFHRTRQGGTDKVFPSDVDEYREAAEQVGAEWFAPRPCRKGDPNAYRVKRYLQHDLLMICRSLKMLQWEIERWTWKRDRQGPLAAERPQPDSPIENNDHLVDCLRYLVNELPEPIIDPAPWQPPTSVAAHWAEELRELDRGGGKAEWYG